MSTQTDKNLVCADCGTTFVFSASDQAFFQERGFSEPRRCRSCREVAKAYRSERGHGGGGGSRSGGGARQMFDVVCANCGVQTQVPFKPTNDRPVYCRDCFRR